MEYPLEHLIRRVDPLSPRSTIEDAARAIAEHGCGMPVAGPDGALIGFIDEADLLAAVTPGYLRDLHGTDLFVGDPSALGRAVARGRLRPVSEHMRTEPAFIDTDDSEMNATARFLQSGQHTLAAIDHQTRQVVGVLRLPDLIADLTGGDDAARPPAP